jgi:hypothetical protein
MSNLVLAALPSLETLFMGLTPDDGISQIMVCRGLRGDHPNNDGPNLGTSLKVIAAIQRGQHQHRIQHRVGDILASASSL